MKRRAFLAAASCVSVGVAGCLRTGSPERGGGRYERCDQTFVRLGSLPTPAEEEATTAITDGVYETEGELVLPDTMDIDTGYLHGGGTTYYEMTATSGDGVERLRAERVRPRRTGLPAIVNRMATELTVDTRITSADELVFEDTVILASGTESNLDGGTTYGYGGYQAELAISTGTETREETVGWRVNHIHGLGDIVVSADDVWMTDGPSVEREGCEWNDEGELVSGDR